MILKWAKKDVNVLVNATDLDYVPIHKATSINGAKDFAGGFGRCGDSSPYDDTDETCAGD